MKNYGLPYMGSKSSLAEWILSYLPPAKNLYDLFCGGCAITHCAIVQERFQNYYINDIIEGMPQGFVDCIKGKYRNDYRRIGHEEFDVLKGLGDLLVDLCFSFGNNYKKGYAYSSKVEPLKKGLHYAICFDDHTHLQNLGIDLSTVLSDGGTIPERRLRVRRHFSQVRRSQRDLQDLQSLESLESLERLQSLESICKNSEIKEAATGKSGLTSDISRSALRMLCVESIKMVGNANN